MAKWVPIPGWKGFYEVSDAGGVRSLSRQAITADGRRVSVRGRTLKPRKNAYGHVTVALCRGGKRVDRPIHRLVLEAFVGPCPEGMECCHNNGVPDDNRLNNLRWDTHRANMRDAERHGAVRHIAGPAHCKATLSLTDIRDIKARIPHETRTAIARDYKVSQSLISKIALGDHWSARRLS